MPGAAPYVLRFDEIGLADIPRVGGKNASLGEMFCELSREGVKVPDGFAITNEILDYTEQKQGVEVRRGDYVLVHTGHIERCLTRKSWDGYSGGDAPGFAFETVDWLHDKEIAGVATDTWGA